MEDDGDGLDGDGLGVATPPVQAVPLSAKLAGTGLAPVEAPLNPKLALAPVAMLPFQDVLVTVTCAPDWLYDPFHSWVTVCPAARRSRPGGTRATRRRQAR